MARRKKLNREIVRFNVIEAAMQLKQLVEQIDKGDALNEIALEYMLRHAQRHINCAWNARWQAMRRYNRITMRDLNRWEAYPWLRAEERGRRILRRLRMRTRSAQNPLVLAGSEVARKRTRTKRS